MSKKSILIIPLCLLFFVSCFNGDKINEMQEQIDLLSEQNKDITNKKEELTHEVERLNEELESVNELLAGYIEREESRTQRFLNDPIDFHLSRDPFDIISEFGEPESILIYGEEIKNISSDSVEIFQFSQPEEQLGPYEETPSDLEKMELIYKDLTFTYINSPPNIHEGVIITSDLIVLKNGLKIGVDSSTVINLLGLPDDEYDSDTFCYYSNGFDLIFECKNDIVSKIYFQRAP